MPHKIEISDKTFEKLKEYCQLNNLKIGQQADKLIYDGLMLEMYGDVPFTNYHIKPRQEVPAMEVKGTLNEDGTFEQERVDIKRVMMEAQTPEEFNQNYLAEPEPIKKEEHDKPETIVVSDRQIAVEKIVEMAPVHKETLKESGVPDKVINRITKRRLK